MVEILKIHEYTIRWGGSYVITDVLTVYTINGNCTREPWLRVELSSRGFRDVNNRVHQELSCINLEDYRYRNYERES
jgi:hypothetical protein